MKIDKIYAYKHNRSFHRLWDNVEVLSETKDYYIFLNKINSNVYEKDDYFWKTKEDAIIYFSKNHWFNIILMFKKGRIVYYCNLATPPVYEKNSIKYIDYELDVKYFTNTKDRVLLDQNEYNYYKKKFGYSKWLEDKIESEKQILYYWIDNEIGPFSEVFRNNWKDKIKISNQKYSNNTRSILEKKKNKKGKDYYQKKKFKNKN